MHRINELNNFLKFRTGVTCLVSNVQQTCTPEPRQILNQFSRNNFMVQKLYAKNFRSKRDQY